MVSGEKRDILWGNYHFWVMNDHLWGPSVHVDKSFTKIQARVRPPPHSGNACILGASGPITPPLLCEGRKLQEKGDGCGSISGERQLVKVPSVLCSLVLHCWVFPKGSALLRIRSLASHNILNVCVSVCPHLWHYIPSPFVSTIWCSRPYITNGY